MSYLSDIELAELQLSKLHRKTPFIIQGVSQSQFSIARHYGGCKVQGRGYRYQSITDELVREDVLKWMNKLRKAKKKEEKEKAGRSLPLALNLPL